MFGLPALSVLNVLNFAGLHDFHNEPFEPQHKDWTTMYLKRIEQVAEDIFGIRSAPNLVVLAFGRKSTYTNKLEKQADLHPRKQCFVRSGSRDSKAPGMDTTRALPIEWNLAKYVVPECDLLDYETDSWGWSWS